MTDLTSKSSAAAAKDPGTSQGGINPALIENVSVTLEAFLGEVRMTVAELTALKKDSVLTLDSSFNQEVALRLNGVAVARAELVAVGDRFAVRLVEISK